MSNPRPDLPNDRRSAQKYVDYLIGTGLFTHIYLQGSRSPKRSKKPTENSDWDFYLVSEIPNLSISSPRDQGKLHACIVIGDSIDGGNASKVELYPKQEYKI